MEGRRSNLNRAIFIGAIFSLLIVTLDPYRVLVSRGASLTSDFSTGAAFFYFFVLILINFLLQKLRKPLSLTPQELVIIYGMMLVACAIPTWGFTLNLLPLLAGIFYYADASWIKTIYPHIPSWLVPQGKEVVQHFFEGLPPGESIPWIPWLKVLLAWGTLIMAVYLFSLSVMFLLRDRWVEEERLSYPLVVPSSSLIENRSSILKDPLLWVGFLLSFIILSLNSLHTYFPFLPQMVIRKKLYLFRYLKVMNINLFFEVVGFFYFVPLEISLGIWLFYLIFFIQDGFLRISGMTVTTPEPWATHAGLSMAYQSFGAMMAMVIMMLIQERNYLRGLLTRMRAEPWIRRPLLLSLASFLFIWGWLSFAGLKIFHAFVFLIITFLIFLALTRIVVQAGTPYARSGPVPAGIMLNLFGTERIGARGITILGLNSPWSTDLRTLVMASVANFLKLTHTFKVNLKKVFLSVILACIIGLLGSFFVVLKIAYKYGGINLGGWQFLSYVPYTGTWIKEYILYPYGFGKYQFSFFSIGVILYLIFYFLRMRLPFFPIHPIGITIAPTWPIFVTWFSVLIGWFVKFLILKYGGFRVYNRLRPLFIGMIFGAFFAGGLWMFIDFLTGISPATHPILGA